MKKTLLLGIALLGLGMAANAKQLTFYYDGTSVGNGSTIEFSGYEEFDWGVQIEAFMEPKIYLESDIAANVAVTSKSNFPVQLCIGGQCEAAEQISKTVTLEAGKRTDLLLDCSVFFDKGEAIVLPYIESTIEAYYIDSPADKTTIYLKMGSAAGVEGVAADMSSIGTCCNAINYSMTSPTVITVADLNGRVVESRTVSGNGRIDLSELPAGVYVYSTQGAMKASGKIFIK